MAEENNSSIIMLVLSFVFFFIGGLKLYQSDIRTAAALLVASILIFISYFLLNSGGES